MAYCPLTHNSCHENCMFYTTRRDIPSYCMIRQACFLGTDIVKAATIIGDAIKEAAKESKSSELDKCVKTFVDGSSAFSITKE